MGIIQFFKELSNFKKVVTDAAKAASEEPAELPVLSPYMDDDTLFETAVERIDILVELHEEDAEHAPLTLPQRYCYALNLLELEVNNGGLCQFFVNSSRLAAPWVSDGLAAIGAAEHKELFDGFIGKYRIDVKDLSSFSILRVRDFEKQAKRYPFDEYDDRFYTLPSLREPLTAYIRQHLDEF
ncbi:MAG: DUF4375 domain-containing protein [Ruminococcaceae bacterium]|nr:DUF4375 domain-containing protein [Oscillospiraceae bacterium]